MSGLQEGYERRIGRYGPSLARELIRACGLARGQRVLDVGAGTGALTEELAACVGPESVVAIDPDPDALALCRARVPGVETVTGAAEQLPFGDGEFDAALAQLVVGLLDDPRRGVGEMRRVVSTGGVVAACVWDFVEGMTVLRRFWDAAIEVQTEARAHDQALTRGFSGRGDLEQLFRSAGLLDVEAGALEASTEYASFDDLWEPMLIPDGAPGRFLATISDAERGQVREGLRHRLGSPDAPFRLNARAWYALGRA
jgi:SAM-dependent methyltransferase